MSIIVSVIIPALNEEALIGETLESVRFALERLPQTVTVEVIVVDNGSTDRTRRIVESTGGLVRLIVCPAKGAARSRNLSARTSRGEILIFLDADTTIQAGSIKQIVEQCLQNGIIAGMTRLAPRKSGFRANLWWMFWNSVRWLPLAYAKAMPAFMFCTREAFDDFGPFNEDVAIGEEWPILAGVYRRRRSEFLYLFSVTAYTSSRRMELVAFGYVRLLLKYVWAILDYRGRVHYSSEIRQDAAALQDLK